MIPSDETKDEIPETVDAFGGEKTILDPREQHTGESTRPGVKVGEIPREIPVRLGAYIIDSELGRGAMGVVYKASQKGLNRPVALKILLRGPLAPDRMKQRFRREAKSIAKLNHPNIVTIYETGEFEDQPFFTMELIDGLTLDDFVRKINMKPLIIADLCRRIAEAVHYAHKRGIIHRDLKPNNILINAENEPIITDFGLAKELNSFTMLSMTGDVMGTPAYMAPEQADGRVSEVGVRSDVYSLGTILYSLLLRRDPFEGRTMVETLNRVIHEEPPPVHQVDPTIDSELAAICSKAMEKDPVLRYTTAKEMAEDLTRFIDGKPVKAQRWSWRRNARKWARRNQFNLAVVAICLTAILIASFLSLKILGQNYLDLTRKQLASENVDLRTQAVNSLGTEFMEPQALHPDDVPSAIDLYLRTFQDPAPEVRLALLRTLAQLPSFMSGINHLPDGFLPWLKAQSEDHESAEVSAYALQALGNIRHPEIAEYLISRLDEPNPAIRLKVIRSLGDQRSRKSIRPLFNVILKDPIARDEAQAALEHVYQNTRFSFSQTQTAMAGRALSRLQTALAGYQDQIDALEQESRTPATQDLWKPYRDALNGQNLQRALVAIRELGKSRDAAASAILLDNFNHQDKTIADASAYELGKNGVDSVIDQLPLQLRDPDPSRRARTALAMGVSKRRLFSDELLARIRNEPNRDVQEAMMIAVEEINHPDAQATLEALRGEFTEQQEEGR